MSDLFDIRLESDLSEFDSTVTDGGDLSWGSPGLASSSGKMVLIIDDTTSIYGVKGFTATGTFRARFYIDPNGISQTDLNDYLLALTVYNSSAQICGMVYLEGNDGSTYRIATYGYRDDGGWNDGPVASGVTDAEHYVEVHFWAGSGANGGIQLWVDGVDKGSAGFDTDTRWANMSSARFGAQDIADTSGTFWLDEFKANNDGSEIGPLSGGTDELTASGITCGAPPPPGIGQVHDLSVTDVATGAPALGAPTIEQVHALSAAALATGAPSLGAPTIEQIHALAATGVATGAPTLGTPTVSEAHALAAGDLATGSPTLGTPAIGQTHALIATAPSTGPPTLGTPTILTETPATRTYTVEAETRTFSVDSEARIFAVGAESRTYTA